MWGAIKIWTENLTEIPNGFLSLTQVPPMIQMKTQVLNLKTLKTQVPMKYLTNKKKKELKVYHIKVISKCHIFYISSQYYLKKNKIIYIYIYIF